MAKFEWIAFLNRHRVPYNTRGPNTPSGAITVACPFCGPADPSDHMVVWRSGGWRCWRNHHHRGKHPAQLVQALIHCSAAEAQRITATASIPAPSDLARAIAGLKPRQPTPVVGLEMPEEFRPLNSKDWAAKPFRQYLWDRGFKANSDYLHWRYGLRYCTRGPFHGRLIFPVVHRGQLISWTGRTIYDNEENRYKSLTVNPEVAAKIGMGPALAPINHHFLWYDWLTDMRSQEAHTFVLCEGPFDALKINVLGEPVIVSTCWMGSEPTKQQIGLLHALVQPFKRRYVISDRDMPQKAIRIANTLTSLGFEAVSLPANVDDPAELQTYKQLAAVLAC